MIFIYINVPSLQKRLRPVTLAVPSILTSLPLAFAPVELTVLDGIADADVAELAGGHGHDGHEEHGTHPH